MAFAYFHPDFSLESDWRDNAGPPQYGPRAWVAGNGTVGVSVPVDEYDHAEVNELITMLERAMDYAKWAPKPDYNDSQGVFEFMAETECEENYD